MGSTCWKKQEEWSRLDTYIRMMLDTWIRMIRLGADNVALLKGSPTSLSFQSSSEIPIKQIDKQVPLHVVCLDFQNAFHKALNSSKEFKDNEQPWDWREVWTVRTHRGGRSSEELHSRCLFYNLIWFSLQWGDRSCLVDALSMFSDSCSTRAYSVL